MDFQTETLVLVAGVPASGKSTFLKNLRWEDPLTGQLSTPPQGAVLSTDELRKAFFGTYRPYNDHWAVTAPRASDDPFIFETLLRAVETRMRDRLTTFVEAVMSTQSERNAFAELAKKHGMPVQIVMLDAPLGDLLDRNLRREQAIPSDNLTSTYEKFDRASAWPTTHLALQDASSIHVVRERRVIDKSVAIDVIGDVHGLLQPLLQLLDQLGYQMDEHGVPRHPQGRKLLFLGDMVDRGEDSLAVLELVRKAVELGGHYAIRGNHEQKVLHFLHMSAIGKLDTLWSAANAKTSLALLRKPPEERERLERFLRELPGYYLQGDVCFAHADLAWTVQPGNMALSECCYGRRQMGETVHSDDLFETVNPTYSLVRGHIPSTTPAGEVPPSKVAVVYDKAEYGGNLVAMRLQAGAGNLEEAANQMVRVPTNFHYMEHRDTPEGKLKRELDRLVKDRLVHRAFDAHLGLSVYKYADRVHFDNLWDRHPALRRARGIVFDVANDLVQNTFTKVFNHHENGTELDEDTQVVAVGKLNGYFTAVSRHPAKHQELLVSTTGSLESDFVKMSREFIKEQRAFGPLLRELQRLEPLTLMFEVVHPDDPHIVQQSPSDYGLYLIGARPLQADALEWTEEALDELAARLGSCVKRPTWERVRFGEVVQQARTASNVEGWMVREDTAEQRTLMKKKSSWYLTTKLLGRLNEGKIKHMYAQPATFKKRVDEEFFPLVDGIVSSVPLEEFLRMDNPSRVKFVAELIG